MKIGVFGGTFDPVHIGHTILAVECWHELKLDKVLFVPANVSPFKTDNVSASSADRLNMLRLALGHDPRFGICTLELDKGGVSYTVDTLKELKLEYGPSAQLFFLAGADSAEGVDKWKDVEEIMKMVTFCAVSRPGILPSTLTKKSYEFIEMPLIEVSSSMIRERIREKRPIDGLVVPSVVEYIRNKGLYEASEHI